MPIVETPKTTLIHAGHTGQVLGLVTRGKRREPVTEVTEWDLSSAADHARSSKRAVTLISSEQVQAVAAILGRDGLDWKPLRRNVLLQGINPLSLIGRTFAIGDQVILKGTRSCDPCERMEEIVGTNGYAAMVGMGGVCASIVQTGIIRVGDRVRVLEG
ncbi:MAG: MOSC domain-containing protein [Myxococcota bacterium]